MGQVEEGTAEVNSNHGGGFVQGPEKCPGACQGGHPPPRGSDSGFDSAKPA